MAVPYVPTKGDNNWDVGLGQSLEWLNSKIDTTATNAAKLTFVTPPIASSSAGTPGTVAFDGTHMYLCVGGNNWYRFTKDSGF